MCIVYILWMCGNFQIIRKRKQQLEEKAKRIKIQADFEEEFEGLQVKKVKDFEREKTGFDLEYSQVF